jgi:hypothetical protein
MSFMRPMLIAEARTLSMRAASPKTAMATAHQDGGHVVDVVSGLSVDVDGRLSLLDVDDDIPVDDAELSFLSER